MLAKKRRQQMVQIESAVQPKPHQTFERRRYKSTQREIEKQTVDPVEHADLHLDVKIMLETLETVNPRMATVLAMEMAGYPESSIASAVGLSASTAHRLKISGHIILRCLFSNYLNKSRKF